MGFPRISILTRVPDSYIHVALPGANLFRAWPCRSLVKAIGSSEYGFLMQKIKYVRLKRKPIMLKYTCQNILSMYLSYRVPLLLGKDI